MLLSLPPVYCFQVYCNAVVIYFDKVYTVCKTKKLCLSLYFCFLSFNTIYSLMVDSAVMWFRILLDP